MTKAQKEEIQYLLTQYIDGRASLQQEELLFQYLNEKEDMSSHEEIIEELIAAEPELTAYNPAGWQPVLNAILGREQRQTKGSLRNLYSPVRWVAAAAVLIMLGLGAYFFFKNEKPNTIALVPQEVRFKNDRAPGHDGAILTLSNGKQVVLDSAGDGPLADPGGTQITKRKGVLTYSNEETSAPVSYNTMTTPKGRQYRLVLADGSRVWLNAASSVTYPTSFTGNQRTVSITGEAYFEVAHNADKPFVVQKGGMSIEVLGTHFNVNAYDDEPESRTTLLEGKVKLSKNGRSSLLLPGQQLQITALNEFRLSTPDVNEVTAWKAGYFQFNNESIASIMRQVARWYDVDVEFKGGIKQNFKGKIPREVSLADLLRILESTGWVHFRLDGNGVTVMP